jgi:hypothetical protein
MLLIFPWHKMSAIDDLNVDSKHLMTSKIKLRASWFKKCMNIGVFCYWGVSSCGLLFFFFFFLAWAVITNKRAICSEWFVYWHEKVRRLPYKVNNANILTPNSFYKEKCQWPRFGTINVCADSTGRVFLLITKPEKRQIYKCFYFSYPYIFFLKKRK